MGVEITLFMETVPNCLMKAPSSELNTIQSSAGLGSCEGAVYAEIEKQDEVGHEAVDGRSIRCTHPFTPKTSSPGLIRERAVKVAVAKDDIPTCDRRSQQLPHVLSAPCSEEKHLGDGVHFAQLGVEKSLSDPIPSGGAPGFPSADDSTTKPFDVLGQETELGGLTAPLNALERDEESGAHGHKPTMPVLPHCGREELPSVHQGSGLSPSDRGENRRMVWGGRTKH
jgi:hypothetical protein